MGAASAAVDQLAARAAEANARRAAVNSRRVAVNSALQSLRGTCILKERPIRRVTEAVITGRS